MRGAPPARQTHSAPASEPVKAKSMTQSRTPLLQPVRRDLTDPRSSRGPVQQPRQTLLNDARSTRRLGAS